MNIIKIGLIGVAGVLLALQFKGGKTEYAAYISIVVSILIFSFMAEKLSMFVKTVRHVTDFIQLDTGYVATMLKMLGITYVSEFTAGVCKDAGHQTIATQIEIFAKLTIFLLGMPILLALLDTIREFLK